MAFKMSKADSKRRDEVSEKIRNAYSELESQVAEYNDSIQQANAKLEDALSVYNSELEEARSKFTDAITAYNEALEEGRQFVEDIASQAESDRDDKTERWQEGDRGQAVNEWIDSLREPDLDDISIDLPDDIEIEFPGELSIEEIEDHAQLIDDLPEEPNFP